MKKQHIENKVVRGIHGTLVEKRRAIIANDKKNGMTSNTSELDRQISAAAEILNPRIVGRKSLAKRTKAFGILGAFNNLKGAK